MYIIQLCKLCIIKCGIHKYGHPIFPLVVKLECEVYGTHYQTFRKVGHIHPSHAFQGNPLESKTMAMMAMMAIMDMSDVQPIIPSCGNEKYA